LAGSPLFCLGFNFNFDFVYYLPLIFALPAVVSQANARCAFACMASAPGMGDNLAVKVHYGVDNSDH
jgi:hypothetical protein